MYKLCRNRGNLYFGGNRIGGICNMHKLREMDVPALYSTRNRPKQMGKQPNYIRQTQNGRLLLSMIYVMKFLIDLHCRPIFA